MADVFPYYAGFSFEWACRELARHSTGPTQRVLDPWNGSGTTTLAAGLLGMPSVGVDRNPVANIVARLRHEAGRAGQPVEPPRRIRRSVSDHDPLFSWFERKTVARLRDWMEMVVALPEPQSVLPQVALFRAVRSLTSHFGGSNPTWVRRTSPSRPPIELQRQELDKLLLEEQEFLSRRLAAESAPSANGLLLTASSRHLPLRDESVQLILTSPPYLTRIDYAVAYARELALLGEDVFNSRRVRSELMGTTLIRGDVAEMNLGNLASDLVRRIGEHGSHASAGYYLKQACQYLDDLTSSLREITRVAASEAVMTLVVQDSFYKDIPVRLGEICGEEAERLGWKVSETVPFEVTRSLTSLNRSARAYTKGAVDENVITLVKR
ncbi:hypothetical protein [Micromonospora musae]|uniref:hypothetical protein n=1 Tax=Micromonospora musae TaxID=1894970 RepID=UPI00343DF62A